jgi:ATP-dependent Clp protease ATP-binding subunit ClpC
MKTFRVYFMPHGEGRMTGTLMRRLERFFDEPPPAAYGRSEDEVLRQLEPQLVELEAEDPSDVERYLWTERFEARSVRVEIHPQNVIGSRRVIGKARIPLRLSYAWAPIEGGGYRVNMPRFGWWFVLEELSTAPEVIKNLIAGSFTGRAPKGLFEYRHQGDEYVRPWSPLFLSRRDEIGLGQTSDREDTKILDEIAEEWVAKTERGRMPKVVGHATSLSPVRDAIDRMPMPSLLLLGPSGVGKTTMVQRVAHYFLQRGRGKHGARRKSRLWSTSADRIVAGMSYLGMWQERVLGLVEELSFEDDYLFVDRLGDLLAAQPGGGTIADLLAPAVVAGEIRLIAECDPSELERCRRRHPRFVDALQLVRLHETDEATTLELMERYQQRRNKTLTIPPAGFRRAIAHLDAFRPDRCFPGKAMQFLDWLAQSHDRAVTRLMPRDVSEAFSSYSGLPVELISDELPADADAIAGKLRMGVIGQDEACAISSRVLARLKARLNDPERPVGNLFFVGPTGVGKTELAKQLAGYMFGRRDRLIRVDMSELMAPGSSQRLMAVGPGVRSLAQLVREQPLSVVLLDEVEKAHREVFDLLLGVLGEGRLTDANGRLVDFRMTLIVMTSNLGAGDARPLGFSGDRAPDYRRGVTRHFRPELVGRLDHVIPFRPLDLEDVRAIVDLELAKVKKRVGLSRRRIDLTCSDAARTRLAELGYHPTMGARPLKRIIEDRVVTPLAVRMAERPDYGDRKVTVTTERATDDDLVV